MATNSKTDSGRLRAAIAACGITEVYATIFNDLNRDKTKRRLKMWSVGQWVHNPATIAALDEWLKHEFGDRYIKSGRHMHGVTASFVVKLTA